jgi:lysophospholipase L1-like esterase
MSWAKLARLLLKTLALFALCNVIFALTQPLDALARFSLHNVVLPPRERLPYGENPAQSYNLSLNSLPAMFASHALSRPKATDEYRVLLLGDSATWGWYLAVEDTLSARLNAADLRAPDGRRMVFYNLGYPIMSLGKDLLLLDAAMAYQPDAVLWLFTLESFPLDKQLFPPLVQHNADAMQALIAQYDLPLAVDDPRFVEVSGIDATLIGQRRALADLLRLQLYGVAWGATGIDQFIPPDIPLRQSDFTADVTWESYDAPANMDDVPLALAVLRAGAARVGDLPLWMINEPMFISSGENSDLHYNSFYPRWAYDGYRTRLAAEAAAQGWQYVDLWNAIAPEEFTDSPVHLTPSGSAQLAQLLNEAIGW